MALGIHWNVLEWPMECVGMCWNLLECVGMAHGMGWNGLEWPLESGGMNLESVGMEFHLESIGIQWNGRFQPFWWIPDGIPWNSNIPVGVWRMLPELMGEGKVLRNCWISVKVASLGCLPLCNVELRGSRSHDACPFLPRITSGQRNRKLVRVACFCIRLEFAHRGHDI